MLNELIDFENAIIKKLDTLKIIKQNVIMCLLILVVMELNEVITYIYCTRR